ncbi:hypothetical protein BCR43DRAFT_27880 [Syncephalastrum racemosum]|uniref:Uncharacterized protein n=1 Tax=Syncephalastrum racemosum TaxID=13706 RepID=A0A1X2HTN4_SYNRA|nr:hypothetical protein BCR43DRAFT_27880 [Syncephalastrum racemosum]
METPPPEEINSTKPEPFPSMSTPALQSTAHSPNSLPRRPRRHTLARPDSALALLSDDLYNEDDTEEEQQEAFDRISDILSNLIQEANDAVHGIQREKAILTQQPKNVHKRSTYPSNSILLSRVSRIPRPSSSCSPSRKRMDTMDASAASPLSPPLTSASTSSSSSSVNTPSVRAETPSPPPPLLAAPSAPVSSVVKRARPVSMPVELRRRRDPLLESYERLDTHMALVESLSRDLAHPDSDKDDQDNTTPATSSRLSSALLSFFFLFVVVVVRGGHDCVGVFFRVGEYRCAYGANDDTQDQSEKHPFSSEHTIQAAVPAWCIHHTSSTSSYRAPQAPHPQIHL